MKKRKIIIIAFWSFGVLLTIISSINFSVRIPKLEREFGNFIINSTRLISNQNQCSLSWKLLTLLQSIEDKKNNKNISELVRFHNDTINCDIQTLEILTLQTQKTTNTQEQLLKWSKMNDNEFDNEIHEKNNKILNKQNKLQENKQRIVAYSIVFHVLGLFSTYAGICFQLWWKS
jgi:hypothetical protein